MEDAENLVSAIKELNASIQFLIATVDKFIEFIEKRDIDFGEDDSDKLNGKTNEVND